MSALEKVEIEIEDPPPVAPPALISVVLAIKESLLPTATSTTTDLTTATASLSVAKFLWHLLQTNLRSWYETTDFRKIAASWLSCFVGVSILAWIHFKYSSPVYTVPSSTETLANLPNRPSTLYLPEGIPSFMIASFGASSILIYGEISSPLAQPKNALMGQMVSAFMGVTVHLILNACGASEIYWLKSALAVSLALAAMQLTKTVNPPGGATALLAVIGGAPIYQLGYWYVLMPVGLGMIILITIASFCHRIFARPYPYWTHQ